MVLIRLEPALVLWPGGPILAPDLHGLVSLVLEHPPVLCLFVILVEILVVVIVEVEVVEVVVVVIEVEVLLGVGNGSDENERRCD
jgi:hypothetical protein